MMATKILNSIAICCVKPKSFYSLSIALLDQFEYDVIIIDWDKIQGKSNSRWDSNALHTVGFTV